MQMSPSTALLHPILLRAIETPPGVRVPRLLAVFLALVLVVLGLG